MLSFGILPRGVLRRIRFDLAGRLVLGQVRFLFDFALTAAQELITLLVLKGSADFRFEFLAPLMGITVATGQTLDFSGFYIWLTSNIGSAELMSLQHSNDATLERHVLTRAQQSLRPEIFARVNEKLVFQEST